MCRIFYNDWGNDMMDMTSLSIHFVPLLPSGTMLMLSVVACFFLAVSAFLFRRGILTRLAVTSAFLFVLYNPSLLEQQREPVADTAIVAIDRSASQNFGERTQMAKEITNQLSTRLGDFKNLEVRTIEIDGTRDTKLFGALDQAFADIPLARRAGVIMVTDGQVHDTPETPEKRQAYGPIHVLLTGEKDENDRQMVALEAPSYGIVGQNISIKYIVRDHKKIPSGDGMASILIRANNKPPEMFLVPVNEEQIITLPVDHAGQNIYELEAAKLDDEITTINNSVPLLVNGVRDRLKVLLVSGQPHAGERTWRDLLTSDPGVDLVHFTILREPEKVDITPQDELSLIAFPFRELFEIKLYDFDLIIFDRYTLNRVLPNLYFTNIANYVRKGGALLEASGPSFAGEESVYTTALKDILPAAPTGAVMETSFIPTLTDLGLHHPVTQNLRWGGDDKGKNARNWGPWLRQIGVKPKQGDVLMDGVSGQPLLILDRVGEGRVAQLASDQIWLWSRGFMGGGPQADLLRRLAHWLMKEPELEENALDLVSDGNALLVRRRNLRDALDQVTLSLPDGTVQALTLNDGADGWLETRVPITMDGIYTADDGATKRFTVVGELNPPEWQSVVTTDTVLKPATAASGGSIHWVTSEGIPDIRQINGSNRNFGGYGWIGLRDNNAFMITGVRDIPFVPLWLSMMALLILAVGAWWLEGRTGMERRRRQR